jgi:hypothetical protein
MPNWKKVVVSGSSAHLNQITGSTFRIDGNQSSKFLGIIDNDQSSAGHVLKLATDGTGNGTYVLDMENGSNTMFRARADGRFAFGNSAVSSMGAGTFVVGIDGGHTSDIAISKRLQHLGDGNTYLDFEADKIILSAGGNLLDYTTTRLSGSAATHLTMAQISSSGDVVADGDIVAYNSSDERLKDNIEVIEGSLDKIGEIRGVEFDWNEKSPGWARERGHDVGVVAQEVQKVLPEIVTERKNGYLGVDYKRIVPLLIESIKELKQEVNDLKKKVN